MRCQTVKKEKECLFWSKKGCLQEARECSQIVEKCEGCARVEEWPTGKYCHVYPIPSLQWAMGICNMATHIKIEAQETQKMLNPLKASKRASKGR